MRFKRIPGAIKKLKYNLALAQSFLNECKDKDRNYWLSFITKITKELNLLTDELSMKREKIMDTYSFLKMSRNVIQNIATFSNSDMVDDSLGLFLIKTMNEIVSMANSRLEVCTEQNLINALCGLINATDMARHKILDIPACAKIFVDLVDKELKSLSDYNDLNSIIICHFRFRDKWGEYLTKGGVTTATIINNDKMNVAAAVCSKNDVFSKKYGRELAIERLKCNTAQMYDVLPFSSLENIKKDIYRAYFTGKPVNTSKVSSDIRNYINGLKIPV